MSYTPIDRIHLEPWADHEPRLNTGRYLPVMCSLLIVTGLLLYIGLWLFRFYYLSFVACLIVLATFAAQGSVRVSGLWRAAMPLFCFLLYQTASLTWSPDLETALEWYGINLTMPIVFVVFYAIGANGGRDGFSGMFRVLTLGCFVAVAMAHAIYGGLDVEQTAALRNLIAGIMILAFPFVIWSYHEHPSPFALPVMAAVFLLALHLGSRAAFVLIPLAYLLTMLQLKSRRRLQLSRVLVGLSAAVIVIAWLVIFVTDPTSVRFDPSSFSLDISADVEYEWKLPVDYQVDVERRLLTYSVIEDFLENPIFGTGYMGTLTLTELKYGRAIPGHGIPSLFSEYGLVGMAIFVYAIVHFFRITKPFPGRFKSLLVTCRIAMVVVLATGLVYQLVELPNFFIAYALGVGLATQARRETLSSRLDQRLSTA